MGLEDLNYTPLQLNKNSGVLFIYLKSKFNKAFMRQWNRLQM